MKEIFLQMIFSIQKHISWPHNHNGLKMRAKFDFKDNWPHIPG